MEPQADASLAGSCAYSNCCCVHQELCTELMFKSSPYFFSCYTILGGVPHTIEREKQQLEDNVGLLN